MSRVAELLGKAYADEWLAAHQYWVGAKTVVGSGRDKAVGEFLEHANDERRHADAIFVRLVRLGAKPAGNPAQWAGLAGCPYTDPDSAVRETVEQNIASEQCAIRAYRELLAEAEDDPETRAMVIHILNDEIEHERDLRETLEGMKTASAAPPFSKRAAENPHRIDPRRNALRKLKEFAFPLGLPIASRPGWDSDDPYNIHGWVAINVPEQEPFARHLALEAGCRGKQLDKVWELMKAYHLFFGQYPWEPTRSVTRRDIESIPKKKWHEYFCDDGIPFSTRMASTDVLPISKRAEDPVRRTAESILKIINFLLFRVPQKDRNRYLQRIRGKLLKFPTGQMSMKKMPQTAAIGQSLSMAKNILSGLNPFFVKRVVDELANMMVLQAPERKRPPMRRRMPGV
jgi:bacterioferritin